MGVSVFWGSLNMSIETSQVAAAATAGAGRVATADVGRYEGKRVRLEGWLHRLRRLGELAFLVIQDYSGSVQAVWEKPDGVLAGAPLESAVRLTGVVRADSRAPGGYEVVADGMSVIAAADPNLPFEVAKPTVDAGLDLVLDHRPLSLRNTAVAAAFRVQATAGRVFRSFLESRGFTEVHTPKIVAAGAEGGAALFPVDYFGRRAYLAQSPQFYKQMLVGAGLERVFEVAAAYRAEEHDTSRHTNEFISLDLEMGFIESEEDVMRLEEEFLAALAVELERRHAADFALLKADLPRLPDLDRGCGGRGRAAGSFPRLTMAQAHAVLEKEFGKASPPGNLDPEGERLLAKWARREAGSDFVFITRWPAVSRPPYAYRDPGEPELTKSFDLLFRGTEITTGGQRIHDAATLEASLAAAGLNPADFAFYTEIFRYGMPPHGGLAIGLERLTAKLLGLSNIREATLFPRDRTRLVP